MQDSTFSKHGNVEVTRSPEPHQDHFEIGGNCTVVSGLLSRIGDKWSILIVSLLGNGTMRFGELRRAVGTISQKMLTSTLRNLERDGFVRRTIHPVIPPKVEYELTDLGHELLCPVKALGQWAIQNASRVEESRARFDQENGDR